MTELKVEMGQKLEIALPARAFGQALLVGQTGSIKVRTPGAPGYVDITGEAVQFIQETGISFGILTVFSKHTTAAIVIQEKESMLLRDMTLFLEGLAPREAYYHHNDFEIRTENLTPDESPNGHAHCQHLLLGSSQVIPIVAGQLALGRWQRIFLVELDTPRDREVLFQVLGLQVGLAGG